MFQNEFCHEVHVFVYLRVRNKTRECSRQTTKSSTEDNPIVFFHQHANIYLNDKRPFLFPFFN